jgi:hypothetical protein
LYSFSWNNFVLKFPDSYFLDPPTRQAEFGTYFDLTDPFGDILAAINSDYFRVALKSKILPVWAIDVWKVGPGEMLERWLSLIGISRSSLTISRGGCFDWRLKS